MDILFFGKLGERIGRKVSIELPSGDCTVRELRGLLASLYPDAAPDLTSPVLRACIDDTIVGDEFPIAESGKVEFFPPLSGG